MKYTLNALIPDEKPSEDPTYEEKDPEYSCPVCRNANLEIDGMLNLVCPKCGFQASGGFT